MAKDIKKIRAESSTDEDLIEECKKEVRPFHGHLVDVTKAEYGGRLIAASVSWFGIITFQKVNK
jgi:SepF-like predicted cell division protein (DUF552 family)